MNSIVAGIDPGLEHVAWAAIDTETEELFYDLVEVPARTRSAYSYYRSASLVGRSMMKELPLTLGESLDRVLVEEMVHYHKQDNDVDPNDLLALAYQSGAIVDRFHSVCDVELCPAREWKGQTPKKVTQARAERDWGIDLSAEFGSEAHNVYDAIGMAETLRSE